MSFFFAYTIYNKLFKFAVDSWYVIEGTYPNTGHVHGMHYDHFEVIQNKKYKLNEIKCAKTNENTTLLYQ